MMLMMISYGSRCCFCWDILIIISYSSDEKKIKHTLAQQYPTFLSVFKEIRTIVKNNNKKQVPQVNQLHNSSYYHYYDFIFFLKIQKSSYQLAFKLIGICHLFFSALLLWIELDVWNKENKYWCPTVVLVPAVHYSTNHCCRTQLSSRPLWFHHCWTFVE